ncbi:MAG: crossover junction endodeoxyribonuclease RuvC [Dehalococcoidia bacterium]|jgi:crossover junction endodeoxyribonuclease RuvC|nr:crossover junction endodeoxyribonuclease RuvC [Dehalococcoidia bacterium]
MRILGIDPGTVTMGYGVVEEQEDELSLMDCGALTTSPKTPLPQRLHTLYLGLLNLIARYQPSEIAIEEPFVAKNVRSALAVGQAIGMAMVAAAGKGIPIHQYTPTQVKQAVSSYGHSGKEQVQEMVKVQLGLPSLPQPSDAADALAVALCHIQEMHLARIVRDREET